MIYDEKYQSLCEETEKLHRSLAYTTDMNPVWEQLLDKIELENVCRILETNTKILLRFGNNDTTLNAEKWRYIVEKSWKAGGHFPVLYKVNQPYDKREVVIAFLMAAELNLENADRFLEDISVNEQNYENRKLYPLHFKEGFFRLVIRWNEKHEEKITFEEAVRYYEAYEVKIGLIIKKQAEQILEKQKELPEESCVEEEKLEVYRNLRYYAELLEPLWNEWKQWQCPYTFRQQDVLQRMLVLCAFAGRAECEYEKGEKERVRDRECIQSREDMRNREGMQNREGVRNGTCVQNKKSAQNRNNTAIWNIRKRNAVTRGVRERGTRLCMSVTERCSGMTDFNEAIEYFVQNAAPAMGEAFWRSFSYIMKNYAESGGNQYANSPLTEKKVFSKRNLYTKKIKKIHLFHEKKSQKEIFSFALRPRAVSEYIQKASANTVLLAELFIPARRDSGTIFGTQKAVSNYSLFSEFRCCYTDWLEGKIGQRVNGELREPMPYYRFKRELVIKYALACGCTSEKEMEEYLEFTGNTKLNVSVPSERLVLYAMEYCRKYGGRKQVIGAICNMQKLLVYYEAESCVKEFGKEIRKRVHRLSKAFLYDPAVEAFGKKNLTFGKQEMLERYYMQNLLCDMVLKIWEMQSPDEISVMRPELVVDILLLTEGQIEIKTDSFLEKMKNRNWLEGFEEEYIEELLEMYFEDETNEENTWKNVTGKTVAEKNEIIEVNEKGKYRELMKIILTSLKSTMLSLDQIYYDNSMELNQLYEKLFFVLAIIERYVKEDFTREEVAICKDLKGWLRDACIAWTFYGGCENFAVSWYEQKYRLNHYDHRKESNEKSGETVPGKHRWRIRGNQTIVMKMWEELTEDAALIQNCYRYLKKYMPHLIGEKEYAAYLEKLNMAEKECRIVCELVEENYSIDLEELLEKMQKWKIELGRIMRTQIRR